MTGMSKQIGGIEPRNYKGRTIGWTAYYANPIDGSRVRRYFHDRDDAQDWLDGEPAAMSRIVWRVWMPARTIMW